MYGTNVRKNVNIPFGYAVVNVGGVVVRFVDIG